jgi:hypothetical protein
MSTTNQDSLEAGLRSILTGYQAEGKKKLAGQKSALDWKRARVMAKIDVEDELKAVLKSMDAQTQSVLGRPVSELNHESLLDLPDVTEKHLRGWVVYIGWVKLDDGKIAIYIGSSVNKDGFWQRVFTTYERPLQYAAKGFFCATLAEAGFAHQAAQQPEGSTFFVRALCAVDIPKDKAKAKQTKKFIHRTEALLIDYFQCLKSAAPEDVVQFEKLKFSFFDMKQLSISLCPEGRQHDILGLNRVHPFCMSFLVRRVRKVTALEAAASLLGYICPLDQSVMKLGRLRLNPMRDYFPWGLKDLVICESCYGFHQVACKVGKVQQIKACRDMNELRILKDRKVCVQSKKFAHITHCQIGNKPLSKRYAIPYLAREQWPCLKGLFVCCAVHRDVIYKLWHRVKYTPRLLKIRRQAENPSLTIPGLKKLLLKVNCVGSVASMGLEEGQGCRICKVVFTK